MPLRLPEWFPFARPRASFRRSSGASFAGEAAVCLTQGDVICEVLCHGA
jgi:hypothetical protein